MSNLNNWQYKLSPEAEKDMKRLDNSQRVLVLKALQKVLQNPLSDKEGGYGKPLGNHNNADLKNCYKIKLKNSGLRIVYKLKMIDGVMYVIIIGLREDVYKNAAKRLKKTK